MRTKSRWAFTESFHYFSILSAALMLLLLHGMANASNLDCQPKRDAHGRISRNHYSIQRFQLAHPCPSTGKRYGRCPGYVVDHVVPLCACGDDAPRNMQWQTVEDAKRKDRQERRQCEEFAS